MNNKDDTYFINITCNKEIKNKKMMNDIGGISYIVIFIDK